VALRKPLEIELPARREASVRVPLRSVVTALDAVALLVAIILSGLQPPAIVFAVLAFALLNADASRAYRLVPRVGDEMGWLLTRTAVPLLVLVSVTSLRVLPWLTARDLERFVLAGSAAIVLVLVGRATAYAVGRSARARGVISEPTLIIGTGRLGVELATALARYPEYGLRPIGFIDGHTAGELPLPLLGAPRDLGHLVPEFGVRCIVVAFGHSDDEEITPLLRGLEELPIEVYVVPRLFELGAAPAGTADAVRGIPLVHLRRPAFRTFARLAKRASDVVAASLLLFLTSPILLVAAVAVRVSSPGPVLFRQIRVGRNGRPFEILKFRTMVVNEESDTGWSAQDHHLTPIGKVLRRASIDELPQLINVVRGDMSLVGPRPERPYFVERFSASISGYEDRLRVAGGITGLAQINGRSRHLDSIPERARLDNSYIETWSLWGDVLVVFRTLALVFQGDSESE
jgi:exopolysaccharide biosynthesis polyprenyl glycosylphosphotransferase